eukprot:scaffold282030_cov44-Tisochrysis_lutea.AAC.1
MRNFAQPVDPHKCTNYAEVFKEGNFGMLRSGKCLTVRDHLTPEDASSEEEVDNFQRMKDSNSIPTNRRLYTYISPPDCINHQDLQCNEFSVHEDFLMLDNGNCLSRNDVSGLQKLDTNPYTNATLSDDESKALTNFRSGTNMGSSWYHSMTSVMDGLKGYENEIKVLQQCVQTLNTTVRNQQKEILAIDDSRHDDLMDML